MQGYLFARPMLLANLLAWLDARPDGQLPADRRASLSEA